MMLFEFPEDKRHFEENIFGREITDEDLAVYFDFRDPATKRKEFNRDRKQIFQQLVEKYGKRCMLRIDGICDENSGFDVDHLIPLSTNKLNKEVRQLKAEKGKKVKTQSFGSNSLANLIIACKKCNGHKKHRLPTMEQYMHSVQCRT